MSSVQSRAVYIGAPADRALIAGWLSSTAPAGDLDLVVKELADAREVLVRGHGQVWWAVAPLAARVVSQSTSRVRVAVWTVRVIASGSRDGSEAVVPAASWTTSTVDLVWEDLRGWSVESVTDLPGPVPMTQSTAQPATSAELVSRLAGFELVRESS